MLLMFPILLAAARSWKMFLLNYCAASMSVSSVPTAKVNRPSLISVTGHLLPDEGKVEWPGRVTVGYLDQQSTLEAGKTIREVLRTAFNDMYEAEKQMLELYDKMAEAAPEEIDKMMNTVGEIQTELEHSGFYSLDTKIEEVANGLGLGSIGLDRDVSELSGGQRSKVLLTKLLLQNSSILLLDEPTNYLDVEHIEWLTRFLQNYEHAFILISHD